MLSIEILAHGHLVRKSATQDMREVNGGEIGATIKFQTRFEIIVDEMLFN